jgi:hypothetical protein
MTLIGASTNKQKQLIMLDYMSVCGSAPQLGCRPIRVRVESIYCNSFSMQYNHPLSYSYMVSD